MRAAIIAVGSELLWPGRDDTNGDWLVEQLLDLGIEVRERSRVGDDVDRIESVVRAALDVGGIVIVTGGLGPTEDDRTREGLARALGRPLAIDPEKLRQLLENLDARGLRVTAGHRREAERPREAEWIENPVGSACGLLLTRDDSLLFALPGVPGEMKAMVRQSVLPRLAGLGVPARARRIMKIAGCAESSVDDRLRDLYAAAGVEVTLLAGVDGLELHLRAGESERTQAESRLDELEHRVRERLGVHVVGTGRETLAVAVGRLLAERGLSLATAESCTAGLLAAAITAVEGSSAWFRGGVVVYSNELKIALAGVRPETLEKHGAVSEAVARELARGVRDRCGTDIGIGITGVAGPGGGTPAKPVGRVYVGLDDGRESSHKVLDLMGERDFVRHRAVATALDQLRRRLMGDA